MPKVDVNGVQLYYEERGKGSPILCIHGAGSTAMMWSEAIQELGTLGRTIAYDRRGCSRSDRPEPYETTTVAEQADDAAALLEGLGAKPAVVIGRSYGGAVAVDLALRHPGSVRALALLEGDALGLSPSGLEWTRAIRTRLEGVVAESGYESAFEVLIEEFLGGGWDSFPDEARRALSRNGPALMAELDYVEQPMPGPSDLATIDVPVLLVAATESPPEQRDMTEAMAAAIPTAQLEIVTGGHLVNPAAPEVLAFIRSIPQAGR